MTSNSRKFFIDSRTSHVNYERSKNTQLPKYTTVVLGQGREKMSQKAAVADSDSHQAKGGGGSGKTKSHSRQTQNASTPVAEAELKRQRTISPEDVMRLEKPTEGKKSEQTCEPSVTNAVRGGVKCCGHFGSLCPCINMPYRLPVYTCRQRLQDCLCSVQDSGRGVRSHAL